MSNLHATATRHFVEELLRSGVALADLCAALLDELPESPASADDLLDMLTGTLGPVTAEATPDLLARATDLIGASFERVLDDLRTAAELAASGRLN